MDIAQSKLDLYLTALDAVLAGQSYTINNRTLTRANIAEIEKGITLWNHRVKTMSRGSALSVTRITPQ